MTVRAKTSSSSCLLPSSDAIPPAFFEQLFAQLSPDDEQTLADDTRQTLAHSLWRLVQQRKAGQRRLRLFNPSLDKDGWTCAHSVLEILTDDKPFLVDSVMSALRQHGLAVNLIIHPVIYVQRSAQGALLNLGTTPCAPNVACIAESCIHIQFTRCVEPQKIDALTTDLNAVLNDVEATVADWPLMREKAVAAIDDLMKFGRATGSDPDQDEALALLTWMNSNNFTFLGYRDLAPATDKPTLCWKIVEGSGLGVLRDDAVFVFDGLRAQEKPPALIKRTRDRKTPLFITKTDLRSRVHRTVPMMAVFVKRYDAKGTVVGERLFTGLFTATVFNANPQDIPYVRQKIAEVLKQASLIPHSHNHNALLHVLNTYPREELFQIDAPTLLANSMGIMRIQERAQVALFLRTDPLQRFVTCLIFAPREHYNSDLRLRVIDYLGRALNGSVKEVAVRVDDGTLARLFVTLKITDNAPKIGHAKLEKELRELTRTWPEKLRDCVIAKHGEDAAAALLRLYEHAFPPTYAAQFDPETALTDIAGLEQVRATGSFVVDLSKTPVTDPSPLCLKLYQADTPVVLSDILPLIENMGLKVAYMHKPHAIRLGDGARTIYLHVFIGTPTRPTVLNADPAKESGTWPLARIKPLFETSFAKIWQGEIENDGFSALTMRAGLAWNDVVLMRALARYLRQVRIPYSPEMVATTLVNQPRLTRDLVQLFHTRLDPDFKGDRAKASAALVDSLTQNVKNLTVIEEDHIIRRYLNLIQSILRTNYYQRTAEGAAPAYLALKFNSRALDYIPLPKPLVEIFVYSARFEAVHLRGGKVARGGIRWSDRREDFRNEILGLMKAQMVKNSVIVPVGSKGGFIVKRPPSDPEKFHAEGVACYRAMMNALLDLTDNRVNGKIVPPQRVVRHDGDDPYLVVAADKGTAQFSDIANAISLEHDFWLGDAFASGGSVGFDHKKMGITARGAWEAVKRHFREIGKDIQTTPFTCVGVGDMSGDVFGNGMLLSPHTLLVAAFDHRSIFLDPAPHAERSFAERQRLFALPRSSWNDYDRSLISKGGGVYARTEKAIKLSPEVKQLIGVQSDSLSPNDLIRALLKAQVELIYFGGIGTYVKASDEANENVNDRANDAVRVDGRDLRAEIIGEGANLGMTQRGRIEAALKGRRLNTDAIDNSAGVDTSDHEVNIKILLSKVMASGALTLAARNKLLDGMTDDVAALVLRDNYRQTLALSVAEARAAEQLPAHSRSIRMLEKSGLLNRAVEFLPDDEALAERQRLGKGLTRPELAVLLSYAKIWLYDELIKSDVPDDDFLHDNLLQYFPPVLQKKFPEAIAGHQLRREIVATYLTNSLINRVGSTFLPTMMDQTGQSAAAIARAYMLTRSIYNLPLLWQQIKQLDNHVPTAIQISMLNSINQMIDFVVPWFLTEGTLPAKIKPAIAPYQNAVKALETWLLRLNAPAAITETWRKTMQDLVVQGVPDALAERVAKMPFLATVPDLCLFAEKADCSIERVADIFFGLGERLNLDWLRQKTRSFRAVTPWQREAVAAILSDLFVGQRRLTAAIVGKANRKSGEKTQRAGTGEVQLRAWLDKNEAHLARYDALLSDLRTVDTLDLAMLTLASRQLSALVA